MKSSLPLMVHFAALIGAGVLAFLAFSSSPEDRSSDVELLSVELTEVEEIRFVTPTKTVRIESRPDGGWTASIAEQRPSRARDGGISEPAPVKTDRYRLDQRFEERWQALLPLKAKRNLGPIGVEQREKFGFDGERRVLEIRTKKGLHSFVAGERTFGGATFYLRPTPSDSVYLVSTDLLRGADFIAPQFQERRLFGVDSQAVERVRVEMAGRTVDYLRTRRADGAEESWVSSDDPGLPKVMVANWIAALFRLSAGAYQVEDELPPLTPVARITVGNRDKSLDRLTISAARVDDEKQDYFARSRFTGQWVKLFRNGTESLVADLRSLMD